MARGFFFNLSTHGPEDLTVEKVKDTAHELGQRLSEVEHSFLHAAVDAAKALVTALGHPATVTFHGVDSTAIHGDDTVISVSVSTPVTITPDEKPITEVMSSSTEVSPESAAISSTVAGTPASVDTAETPSTEVNESTADPVTPASVDIPAVKEA